MNNTAKRLGSLIGAIGATVALGLPVLAQVNTDVNPSGGSYDPCSSSSFNSSSSMSNSGMDSSMSSGMDNSLNNPSLNRVAPSYDSAGTATQGYTYWNNPMAQDFANQANAQFSPGASRWSMSSPSLSPAPSVTGGSVQAKWSATVASGDVGNWDRRYSYNTSDAGSVQQAGVTGGAIRSRYDANAEMSMMQRDQARNSATVGSVPSSVDPYNTALPPSDLNASNPNNTSLNSNIYRIGPSDPGSAIIQQETTTSSSSSVVCTPR